MAHNVIIVIVEIEMPETPTCREPSLPGNVEWTQSSATEFQPQCSEAEKEFKWGYDASAIYTCNMTTLEWEPSTILIPECFRKLLNLSHVMRKPVDAICEQQRRRSACASAQSDQRLCFCCLDSTIPLLAIAATPRP